MTRAKWVDKYQDGDWYCSDCGAVVEKDEQLNHYWAHCYHCGAQMFDPYNIDWYPQPRVSIPSQKKHTKQEAIETLQKCGVLTAKGELVEAYKDIFMASF